MRNCVGMLDSDSPMIMGILNVTPDSFSDGGLYISPSRLREGVDKMLLAGAQIIDVGGESTRPLAQPVSTEDELQRIIPAIKAIRELSIDIPISIDTTKAEVAKAALKNGATIVNDISALRFDPAMVDVVKSYDGPVIIMHMQGTPKNMQVAPNYDNVINEIICFFKERLNTLNHQGIAPERIIIDPGIGFGKTVEHNITIIRELSALKSLGCPVLLGHSRKSFLAKALDLEINDRDCATAMISSLCAAARKADILRVHNVALTKQAVQLASLLSNN